MSSNLTSFEKFCGHSPFWNETLLLESSYPKFTECFKQVALAWIPCFAFLAIVPFYLRHIIKQNSHPPLPASFLNVSKTVCSLALIVVSVVILIVKGTESDQSDIPEVLYVSEGVKTGCFLISMVVIQVERRKSIITSLPLWFFWMILLVASVVPFYSNLKENVQDSDKFMFVMFYVYFGFLTLQLILTSFVEKRQQSYRDLRKTTKPSPELSASVPSHLTYAWLDRLVVKGYRKNLTEEDVFDLNPEDLSDTLLPPFEKALEKEKRQVKEQNKKIRETSVREQPSHGSAEYNNATERTPLIPNDTKKDPGSNDSKRPKSPYKTPSLFRVLLKTYGLSLFAAQFAKTASDCLIFLTPKITEALLEYVATRQFQKEWKGYTLAASYFVVQLIVSLISNKALITSRRIGMRMKSTLIATIYKKSLTITNIDDDTTAGEIVNLMSVDCQKIEDVTIYMYLVLSIPFQLGLALYMLYEQLEVAVFAGMGTLMLAIPANAVFGYFLKKYQMLQMKYKDERLKMMSEVLSGIKVLKLYAWEGSFQEKLEKIRKMELDVVKKIAYIIACLIFIFNSIPYMVQLTAFGVYIAVSDNGYLSPQIAFVSLQLFQLLNIPLMILPLFIPMVIQAGVSSGRISDYLNREDIKPDVIQKDPDAESAIKIVAGEFTWNKEQVLPTLRNVNVDIKPGSLVAVVGSVGCGKSSLLAAMLGEMERSKGTVVLKHSVAYVPQEAWIQNATLRDNILFGSEYNKRRYDKVTEACALTSDLQILPAGDRTEIGEKGINVSGGQKQRVSLARAVYSNKEIYLLDDPLSAVDSHVGKHIFQNVVGPTGVLKRKTRVLVTHGIHWLPLVDSIIVLTDGQISEVGSYEELLSKDGAFAQFLKEHIQENIDSTTDVETDPEVEELKRAVIHRLESVTGSVKEDLSSGDEDFSGFDGHVGSKKSKPKLRRTSSTTGPKLLRRQSSIIGDSIDSTLATRKMSMVTPVAGEKLIEDEVGATGQVKFGIYIYYFKALGFSVIFQALVLYLLYCATSVFSGIWLSEWTDDPLLANVSRSGESEYEEKTNIYLGVYGAAGIGQGMFILLFALIAAVKSTNAAGELHQSLLKNVMRAPMSFFDTIPGGRIVNRFSRDVETIDNMLPGSVREVLNGLGKVLVTIVIISYGTPIFLSVMVPLAILYVLIQVFYIPTSRQLRRLDSITRSPIYTHFSETLSGAASVRAYGVQDRFISESKRRTDHNFKFYFASIAASTWLAFRLQLLGNLVVFAAAIFAVASTDIETGIVGLSVSYATQMTGALEFLVNMMSELQTNIVSVERLKEYAETPREAAWSISDHRPGPDWPQEGDVSFEAYQTRYRPGLDLVLKDITCSIKGGEKIGIVGRTGAGKSSMTVALFRIIEAAGGKIVIDGENIACMGLDDLRSKLTILPQEPVIFSGTLRLNLDPFDQYSDDQLWHALEHAYLKSFVEGLPVGLNYECGEGGCNLSVGQRQLVCLARTLLRKTKILVLDEATAAVDFETDELIQKTIRTEFKDNTVLTIAHRLNTILDYDRIMVLDKGYIKEFDAPQALLSDPNTVFHGMAKDAGLV